jgi:nitroreductase
MAMVKLDPPAQLGMSIGEAMFTQRAIRRLKPDPVSDEDLKTLMDAASKAPSSRNSQSARFLVVRDRDRLRRFGELYHEAWWAKRPAGWTPEGVPEGDLHLSAMRLADAMKDAPLVVLAVSTSPGQANSVLPAVQNLMLAARALGIGSVLTTLHPCVTDRIHELFKLPPEAEVHCCIPLGYPEGRFGTTTRRPTSETTYYEEWGNPPPWE